MEPPCVPSSVERVLTDINLLHVIFGALHEQEALLTTIPLVCKAWWAACGSPGSCWQQLVVDGLCGVPLAPGTRAAQQYWSRLAAWIARRAGGMRTLRLDNLSHLLHSLEGPGQLAALAAVWASLAPPNGLHTIEIGRTCLALAPGTLAGLACLTALRQLKIHTAGPLAMSELETLSDSLPQLEELSVCLLRRRGELSVFTGAFPSRLTHLRHLSKLHLEAPYSSLNAETRELPPCIGEWGSQMQELHLINLGLQRLPPAIGTLRALRELCLGRNRLGEHPDALSQEMTQLTALVRLELQYNGFDAGPPPLVGELSGLRELNLGGNLWGSTTSDLPAEYSQLTGLKYLTLTNCELRVLPPVVAGLGRLELLKLNINQLQTLPGGPYLHSLECLDLAHNRFTLGYPPVLAAASRLHLISFQFRGAHYSDPAAALREALAPQPAHPVAGMGAAAAGHSGPPVTVTALALLPALQPGNVAEAMND